MFREVCCEARRVRTCANSPHDFLSQGDIENLLILKPFFAFQPGIHSSRTAVYSKSRFGWSFNLLESRR